MHGTPNIKKKSYTICFIIVNALHVSGGFSSHHQELKNCIHSIWYVPGLLAATPLHTVSTQWNATPTFTAMRTANMTLDVSPVVTKNIFRNVVCLVGVGTIVAKDRHCVGSQSSGITFVVHGVDKQLQHQEAVMFGEFGIFLTYHPVVRLWTLSFTTVEVCRNL